MEDIQKQIEVLKTIRIDDIGAFKSIMDYIHAAPADQKPTEEMQNQICASLKLNYDHWRYYNELVLVLSYGVPSALTAINIACSMFNGPDIREILERFQHVEKELIITAAEIGFEWFQDNNRLITARKAIDNLVSLYVLDNLGEDEHTRCIAFPSMPEMHPYLVQVFELADKYGLNSPGFWRTAYRTIGQTDRNFMLDYPTDLSEKQNPVIKTDIGTIYLLAAPKRGDTNSNHLRSI
ncbi:hypothetical protein HOS33_gp030 [Erwinia phage vB_EamM_Y3]|uniref:Uncharacterized protein n=1 Tax=Erwinia phage vB_EamM_Y3 TaxID=1983553 RepID=A0A2H4IAY8_9CAUD|nr:hypothetical protein HOS33_gp030 [Erwinia phage vB_EamM_Y3]ARW58670.1 hypothetical protein Y3_030 [Erwinia phage vB_EamM_Y3]